MRLMSFNDAVADHREKVRAIRRVPFDFQEPAGDIPLMRPVERFPFVPSAIPACSRPRRSWR